MSESQRGWQKKGMKDQRRPEQETHLLGGMSSSGLGENHRQLEQFEVHLESRDESIYLPSCVKDNGNWQGAGSFPEMQDPKAPAFCGNLRFIKQVADGCASPRELSTKLLPQDSRFFFSF